MNGNQSGHFFKQPMDFKEANWSVQQSQDNSLS